MTKGEFMILQIAVDIVVGAIIGSLMAWPIIWYMLRKLK